MLLRNIFLISETFFWQNFEWKFESSSMILESSISGLESSFQARKEAFNYESNSQEMKQRQVWHSAFDVFVQISTRSSEGFLETKENALANIEKFGRRRIHPLYLIYYWLYTSLGFNVDCSKLYDATLEIAGLDTRRVLVIYRSSVLEWK